MVFCCCDPLIGPESEDEAVRKEILGRDGRPRKSRSNKVVTVTVPEGMYEGSPIAVMSPDGRAMDAVVPQGVYPGETFLVTFPPPEPEPEMRIETQYIPRASQEEQAIIESKSESKSEMTLPSLVEKLDALLTPVPDPVPNRDPSPSNGFRAPTPSKGFRAPTPSNRPNTPGTEVEAREDDSMPINVEQSKSFTSVMSDVVEKILLPDLDLACSSQRSVEEEPAVVEEREENNPGSPPSSQKYLRVHVPRGMPPGSSMQVEVPGENRTLDVLVPDGVSSFHVAYTPQTEESSLLGEVRPPTNSKVGALQRMGKKTTPPRQERRDDAASPPPQAQSRIVSRSAPIGQKLLLVRVPPGTSPGTTLHVSVPDEPGRILAAVVPPGHVREFHVAYEARAPNPVDNQKSFMRPASPYHDHQPTVGPSRTYPGPAGQRHPYQNNHGVTFFDPANPYQGTRAASNPYERGGGGGGGGGYLTNRSPANPYNYGTGAQMGAPTDNYGLPASSSLSSQPMNHLDPRGYVVTSSAPRPGSVPANQYQQYVQQRGPYPPNSYPYGHNSNSGVGNGDYYNPSYNNNRHLQHHYTNHPGGNYMREGSGVDFGDDF